MVSKILKFILVLLILLVINIGVAIFISIYLDNRNLVYLSNILTLIGFIYLMLAGIGYKGNFGARFDTRINYARSVGAEDLAARAKNDMSSTLDNYRFVLVFLLVGVLSLLLSWLIPSYPVILSLLHW